MPSSFETQEHHSLYTTPVLGFCIKEAPEKDINIDLLRHSGGSVVAS